MALIGITLDRNNPPFDVDSLTFWMPQYTNLINTLNGQKYFNRIYKLINKRITKSIFGADWELAMSYAFAHYLTLISNNMENPSGSTLSEIAGGGNYKGILSSATVGSFNKTYDLDKSMINSDEAKFWNQTSYGASLMALLKTKAIPSIFVVTNNCIPGTQAIKRVEFYDLFDDENEDEWSYDNLEISANINQSTVSFDFINSSLASSKISAEIGCIDKKTKLSLYLNGTFEISYGGVVLFPKRKCGHDSVTINFKNIDLSSFSSYSLDITVFNDKNESEIFIGHTYLYN